MIDQRDALQEVGNFVMAEVEGLPLDELYRLIQRVSAAEETAHHYMQFLQSLLHHRFSHRAHQLRQDCGKDTGTVRFPEEGFTVIAELPKKVEWSQARLAEITRRIADSGEDVRQYVEISYRVSETKFNAWPQTLKTAFESARTVNCGKASYRLALMKE